MEYFLKGFLFSDLLAFGVTFFFLWGLKPIAIRLELVDPPGGRKQHWGAIPLVGGIAMFLGFAFSLLTLNISLAPYRGFIAAAILLVIVGVLDDLHELSPRARLLAQVIASIIMITWEGTALHTLGNVFGAVNLSLWFLGIPFTIFAMVAAINAVNMIDGMDGLAGGVCLIELFFILSLLKISGETDPIALISLLMASLMAFLLFNFPFTEKKTATVFMGDSGSMFLGFTITWLLMKYSQAPHMSFHPIIILWILAIPVFDLVTVTFRRLLTRRSPLKAHRDHIHHILESMGMSPFQCTSTICFFSFLLGGAGVLATLWKVPDDYMLYAFFGVYSFYLVFD